MLTIFLWRIDKNYVDIENMKNGRVKMRMNLIARNALKVSIKLQDWTNTLVMKCKGEKSYVNKRKNGKCETAGKMS